MFVINGGGSARPALEREAAGLAERPLRRPASPKARLPEVLAAADIHVVPLQAGSGPLERAVEDVLDPGRRPAVVASVDPGTEVARIVEQAGAGVAVPPDDPEAFTKAMRRLVAAPDELGPHGRRRAGASSSAGRRPPRSPRPYEELFDGAARATADA